MNTNLQFTEEKLYMTNKDKKKKKSCNLLVIEICTVKQDTLSCRSDWKKFKSLTMASNDEELEETETFKFLMLIADD